MANIITIPEGAIIEDINLYIDKQTNLQMINVRQYDSGMRYIRASVWDNGDLYPMLTTDIICLTATKPDGNPLFNQAGIDGEGRIIYEMTEQTTSAYGVFIAEFRIYNTKQVDNQTVNTLKSTYDFKINIAKSNVQDTTIISTPEFNALTDAIASVGDLVADVSNAIENSNVATANANNAVDLVNDTVETINNETLIIWKPYVATYNNIVTTYPAPELGWTTQAQDTGIRWRYNGTEWINIGVVSDDKVGDLSTVTTTNKINVVGAINELDSQLAETVKKSEVQNMIGNLSDATPLFANNVSEMTDTSRLYVNLADGYLYNNDGTEWVSTGVLYQSTGIAEKSIKCEHLSNDVIKKIKSIETLYEDPVDLWEGRIWITVPSRIAIDTLDQPDPIFIYSIHSAQNRKIGISYIPENDFRLLTAEFGLTSRLAEYHDTGNDIQVSLVTASEIDGLPLFEDPIAIKHITNCPDTPNTPFIGYIDFKEDGINLIAGIRYYFVLEVLKPSTGNSSYSNLGILYGSTTNSIAARYYNGEKQIEPYNREKWLEINEAYDSNIRIRGEW